MAKIKVTKKTKKIEKNIKLLKEKEKSILEKLKKSAGLCIERLIDKKQFSLIFIKNADLNNTIITPCYVNEIHIGNDRSIDLKVEFVIDGETLSILAPFYDIRSVNYKDDNIMIGICENENDCKKIYNHILDLKIKQINEHRMKIN